MSGPECPEKGTELTHSCSIGILSSTMPAAKKVPKKMQMLVAEIKPSLQEESSLKNLEMINRISGNNTRKTMRYQ
jgi:hypothetical protein